MYSFSRFDCFDTFSGSLKNNFDKDKVQSEIDLQVKVTKEFRSNVQHFQAEQNKRLDELKAKKENGEISEAEYKEQSEKIERQKLITNVVAGGLLSPADSVLGVATSAVSPAVSFRVGQHFKKEGKEGSFEHIATHAVIGALTSAANGGNALSGAVSAGGAEYIAQVTAQTLFQKDAKDLTADEKQTVSSIAQPVGVLSGSVTGDSSLDAYVGGTVATNAVENNSLHVDKNGVVIRNIPDNDYNIYQYDYACSPIDGNNCPNLTNFDELYNSPKKVVGQVMWQDSFTSPESGKSFGILHFGENIEPYIYQLNDKAWGQWNSTVAIKSPPSGEYDIKSNYPNAGSYHGFLFQGRYITLRDAGNVLAGMNAAVNGNSFDDFQKASGALQQKGKTGVFWHTISGKTYGSAPMYGELPYQYHKSKYGYNLGLQRVWVKDNMKNITPPNVPSIGDAFNGGVHQ